MRLDANLTACVVGATIGVYNTLTSQLLPTPTKSHYTFNLRDLSKVFQGMTMCPINKIKDAPSLWRLWYHESCRVFQDRLVNNEDRHWFTELAKSKLEENSVEIKEVLKHDQPFYGDFMIPGAENKVRWSDQ